MPTKRPDDASPDVAIDPVADIPLDDWVQSASVTVGRRMESLNAFYRHAQRSGMGRATAQSFDAAFAAFLKQPV